MRRDLQGEGGLEKKTFCKGDGIFLSHRFPRVYSLTFATSSEHVIILIPVNITECSGWKEPQGSSSPIPCTNARCTNPKPSQTSALAAFSWKPPMKITQLPCWWSPLLFFMMSSGSFIVGLSFHMQTKDYKLPYEKMQTSPLMHLILGIESDC